MKNKLIPVTAILLLFSTASFAETVYVKERQSISIRSGITAEDPVVGRAVTGTGMELLEQTDTHTRVRAADGTEGWIANSLVTRDKPAELRILSAETRMKQAQSQAAALGKKVKELEKQLKEQAAQAPPASPEPPAENEDSSAVEGGAHWTLGVDYLWIGISFAMLIIGFVAGATWLRERTRRKLGGMHIRVS